MAAKLLRCERSHEEILACSAGEQDTVMAVPSTKCLFDQNCGQINLSMMAFRTFLNVRKVICDQLLASRALIIQSKALFNLYVMSTTKEIELEIE